MRVRAKLTLRNDKLISARERLGLTQIHLAELADVPIQFVSQLESLNYSAWDAAVSEDEDDPWRHCANKTRTVELDQRARRVADALELDVQDVLPADLRGHKIESTVSRVADVNAQRLLQVRSQTVPLQIEEVDNCELRSEARKRIQKVLKTLSYREREIIKLRYGIGDGETYTLEEVGHIFGVTRDRIRQIEAKAVCKLQQPSRADTLAGLVEGDLDDGTP